MRQLLAIVLVGLAAFACTDRRKEAIEKIGHDEEIIKRASGAVSEVIRNSTDCETAKPLIPEARQRIAEAREQVSAPATQATLGALEAQLDRVAQACP